MRHLRGWIMAAALALGAGQAIADDSPVVVELFTSQGCSSCPPADTYLHELAKRSDVIALAMHVDYWDYIGWKDKFASPRNTARQKAYAVAAGRRSVYTPQMIVDGSDDVVGAHPKDVEALIRAHAARARSVAVVVTRDGARLRVSAEAGAGAKGPFDVVLARILPRAEVVVTRGENAGKTLSYANIVTDWDVIGQWDGRSALSLDAAAPGGAPVVVLVQRSGTKGPGQIEAAALLR